MLYDNELIMYYMLQQTQQTMYRKSENLRLAKYLECNRAVNQSDIWGLVGIAAAIVIVFLFMA